MFPRLGRFDRGGLKLLVLLSVLFCCSAADVVAAAASGLARREKEPDRRRLPSSARLLSVISGDTSSEPSIASVIREDLRRGLETG